MESGLGPRGPGRNREGNRDRAGFVERIRETGHCERKEGRRLRYARHGSELAPGRRRPDPASLVPVRAAAPTPEERRRGQRGGGPNAKEAAALDCSTGGCRCEAWRREGRDGAKGERGGRGGREEYES